MRVLLSHFFNSILHFVWAHMFWRLQFPDANFSDAFGSLQNKWLHAHWSDVNDDEFFITSPALHSKLYPDVVGPIVHQYEDWRTADPRVGRFRNRRYFTFRLSGGQSEWYIFKSGIFLCFCCIAPLLHLLYLFSFPPLFFITNSAFAGRFSTTLSR